MTQSKFALPTERVFLLLFRDDYSRGWVGTAWNAFTYLRIQHLNKALEGFRDQAELPSASVLKELHLILYRYKDTRELMDSGVWNPSKLYKHAARNGKGWNAYTFDDPEERDAMIQDTQSHTSAWKEEAVTVVSETLLVPKRILKHDKGVIVLTQMVNVPITEIDANEQHEDRPT